MALIGGILTRLIIGFKIFGYQHQPLCTLFKLPPIIGCLVSAIIFRNLPWFKDIEHHLSHSLSSILKKFCLSTILTVAGLSFDIQSFNHKVFQIIRLTTIPQLLEAIA